MFWLTNAFQVGRRCWGKLCGFPSLGYIWNVWPAYSYDLIRKIQGYEKMTKMNYFLVYTIFTSFRWGARVLSLIHKHRERGSRNSSHTRTHTHIHTRTIAHILKRNIVRCECCPGHYLIVNHYSSMLWSKCRNLSVIVNWVTKSLNH